MVAPTVASWARRPNAAGWAVTPKTSRRAGPHTLAEPVVLAERQAALGGSHMRGLNRYAEALRQRHGAVPFFDPFDAGTSARLLLLLETPGPSHAAIRFCSRDNPTGTAANLRRFLAEASWERHHTLLWNAVPWVVQMPGQRNRAPRAAEIEAGLGLLPELLALLPRLRAVVLAGRVAGRAAPVLASHRPDLAVLQMPHPSPTHVCTDAAIPGRILAALAVARATVDRDDR